MSIAHMKTSGIYGYIDSVYDEIVYIGQSKNMWGRHKQHYALCNFRNQTINQILQRDYGRYGFLVLKQCPISKLDYWEKTLIALYNPRYNQQKRYMIVEK